MQKRPLKSAYMAPDDEATLIQHLNERKKIHKTFKQDIH